MLVTLNKNHLAISVVGIEKNLQMIIMRVQSINDGSNQKLLAVILIYLI